MAEAYTAEIRIMSFPYAPRYWAQCNGQTMYIAQNSALFSLLGTTYGGDGVTTFNLPDLRQRVPMHRGGPNPIAATGGEGTHTLTQAEVPGSHSHPLQAVTTAGDQASSVNNSLASGAYYADSKATPNTTLNPAIVQSAGGTAHNNMQPYLGVNFCICLFGIFPSRP